MSNSLLPRLRRTRAALVTGLALVVTGCGADATGSADAQEGESSSAPSATEAAGPQPRLAVTYEGGVLVMDAESGEVLLDVELPGYLRLSPAGDERHVMVSRSGGFTALDLGAWTEAHGDHGHSWTLPPALTDVEWDAEEPGHVVPHHGRTTLFDDATGKAAAFDSADLAEARESGDLPEMHEWAADEAHHGVAFQIDHADTVTSVGDAESRSGIEVATRSGEVVASTDDCPGLHGEAFAGDVALFGCEDGVVLLDGKEITKLDSPDEYGRIGNQAGHDSSTFVLGDYKTDPDAELERPTRVAAVDTARKSLKLVDLPASYSFRSLGRTADGDGLVLGTDGKLHRIDLAAGEVTRSTPVVAPWEEPIEWQDPRPTLEVVGDLAYVTEPSRKLVHVVDVATGKKTTTLELPQVPDEIVGITG